MGLSTRTRSQPAPLSSPAFISSMQFRFGKRVAKCKDTIRQAAVRIDEENATMLQQRRQWLSTISRTETENTKCQGQLVELEKLKVEITDAISKKRRALKWLMRRLKIKLDEEESPTQILMRSKYITPKGGDADVVKENQGQYDEQTFEEIIIDEEDYFQRNNRQQEDGHQHQPEEEQMTFEERRLAARAKVVEEIRMAKEVKRHIMENMSKEREEAKLVIQKNDDNDDEEFEKIERADCGAKELIAGVQISSLCKILECVEDELYDSDSDSSFDPANDMLDDPSADIGTVENTIADLVKDIEGYKTRLSDIELMQSTILAENAALCGKNEFKFGRRVTQIDAENDTSTSATSADQSEQSLSHLSRFGRISRRVGQTMNALRRAAAKLDRDRLEQIRRTVEQ